MFFFFYKSLLKKISRQVFSRFVIHRYERALTRFSILANARLLWSTLFFSTVRIQNRLYGVDNKYTICITRVAANLWACIGSDLTRLTGGERSRATLRQIVALLVAGTLAQSNEWGLFHPANGTRKMPMNIFGNWFKRFFDTDHFFSHLKLSSYCWMKAG